jgi:hypothetical protein
MILALLLAASAPQTAVKAEREFAATAQTKGLWTAFRATAADDAMMFVPEKVRARDWLEGRKDPPFSMMWWPARIDISCDGELAVSSGPWIDPGRSKVGMFLTVWQHQADGRWKWVLNQRLELAKPMPAREEPVTYPKECERGERADSDSPHRGETLDFVYVSEGSMPANAWPPLTKRLVLETDGRMSLDHSLKWTLGVEVTSRMYEVRIYRSTRDNWRTAIVSLQAVPPR